MKKYDKYKETNIEWMGEIPEHWEVKNMRYASPQIYAGGTPSTKVDEYWNQNDYIWLPSGRVQNKKIERSNEDKYISQAGLENSSTKLIDPYTTLIALTGATCGNVGYLTFQACANQSVVSIKSNKSFNSKYLFYYLLSQRDQIRLKQSGGAQGGINTEDVKSLDFVSPSIEEQSQISSYLDDKTSLIDKLINNNKKLIKLLEEKRTALINKVITKGLDPNVKMKDSGIEWIGEIPGHWDTSRIKRVADIFGRIGFRGYTTQDIVPEGEGAITLSPSNIKSTKMLLDSCTYLSWEKYKESPEIIIFKNDIIFVKTGSTIGKVAMVEIYPQEMTINPQLIVLKNVQMDRKYLYYNMVSMLFQYQVKREIRGGSTPAINQEKINNLKVIQPPLSEQIEISSYLDNKTSLIDISMKRIKDENNLLKEYRQSLISNVVTGKMKVVNL